GNSGSEDVFRDARSCIAVLTAHGLERGATGFPMHGNRERAGGCVEQAEVGGDVIGRNGELRIAFSSRFAPAAGFLVHFSVGLLTAPIVKSGHAENRGRLEPGDIADDGDVVSVTKAARGDDLGARPLVVFLFDAEMEGTFFVGPGVVSIVEIVQAAAIAGDG